MRVLAAVEVLLGGVALAVPARWVSGLVALSYLGFALVTALALARDLPIDSCGCLGRLDTPPSWRHLLVLGAVAVGALGSVVVSRPALLERLGDGVGGVVFALAAVVLTIAAVVSFRAGRRPT